MDVSSFVNQLPHWSELGATQDLGLGLGHFRDWLMSRPPRRVSSVITLRPRDDRKAWRRESGSLFLAIGRFHTEYSLIAEVARSIAPAIIATGNVPLIRPVHEDEIEEMPEESLFAERVRALGVRLWEVGSATKP